jgi:hypothetical protein
VTDGLDHRHLTDVEAPGGAFRIEGIMSIVIDAQTSSTTEPIEAATDWSPATADARRPGSRIRELLAMLAVLLAVAGVGALMVACTV